MSKTNPNQQYYKTGGRSQSDGPDRADATTPVVKPEVSHVDERNPKPPAVMRSKKK